jgi:hypothetical protein
VDPPVNGKIDQWRQGIHGTENHIWKANQLGTHIGIGFNADIARDKKEIDLFLDRFDMTEIDFNREAEIAW